MDSKDNRASVLTTDETNTLTAMAERIFPKTDTPGALEIGAVHYIELALGGDYEALAPLYRAGLRFVGRYAKTKFGRSFHSLSDAEKDAVLLDFEAGTVAGFKQAAEFFETVRYHVLEGVFCEPHYGGNRDLMGWRLVNFPGQQFGYANSYINQRVDIEPVAADSTKAEEK